MSAKTTSSTEVPRVWRLGLAVTLLGLLGWAVALAAAARIPSPAHETVFVDARGRALEQRPSCHDPFVVDQTDVWMSCQTLDDGAPSLARFDTRTGRATVLGLLPEFASGLSGGIVAPDGARVFLQGNHLVEVRTGRVGTLGAMPLPLGMATVGDGVEVVRRDVELRVSRFVGGRPAGERALALPSLETEQLAASPVRAFHDGRVWRVVVATYPRNAAALPVRVVLHEQGEDGALREIGQARWGEGSMYRSDGGEVMLMMGPLLAGHVVSMHSGVHELQVLGPHGLTTVGFPDSPPLDVGLAYMTDGPHARVTVTDVREAYFWLDGEVTLRVTRDGRFVSTRRGERRGPPVASDFWMTGFSLVAHADGSATLLGALGGAYVHVGADLERTDVLSFPQRVQRLFVADRAKRNSDMDGLGLARFAIIPFILLGPLLGALVLATRERTALARRLAIGWLVVALAGAYPFCHYLRFYF